MKPSLDRAARLVWLLTGILLLLFLAGGGVMILAQWLGNRGAADEAERVVSGDARPAAAPEPVTVRYRMPDSILGTATRIVPVEQGGARDRRSSYGSDGYRDAESAVNVMFVDADGVRLLLDRPAFIRHLSYPEAGDAPRAWISYVAALDDTDRSGEVDARDAVALYVTDLDGRNLRPVLGPPLRYRSHAGFGPSRILVHALEAPAGVDDESRMRQRAFLYDVASRRLSPYAAMDSAAERAGRILQR